MHRQGILGGPRGRIDGMFMCVRMCVSVCLSVGVTCIIKGILGGPRGRIDVRRRISPALYSVFNHPPRGGVRGGTCKTYTHFTASSLERAVGTPAAAGCDVGYV